MVYYRKDDYKLIVPSNDKKKEVMLVLNGDFLKKCDNTHQINAHKP